MGRVIMFPAPRKRLKWELILVLVLDLAFCGAGLFCAGWLWKRFG